MFKSSLAIAAIVIAFILSGAPPLSAQDMVLNGNFELQTISPWVLFGGNQNTALAQRDVDGVGGNTTVLEKKPGTPDDNGGVKQDVLLVKDVTYTFDADIRYYTC
jgi:hypothetical protein